MFVEVTPNAQRAPVPIGVFSGERHFEQPSPIVERQGRWYFPPIAALITAGGRLLLAMLERCVTDAGGTYLFCDTDSLCIVASARGGVVSCEGGPRRARGRDAIRALSRAQVVAIANRFASLNLYDSAHVPGPILKIEKINFDDNHRPRALCGFAISAKRYVLYERTPTGVRIVDPKAHGLGYLYPPIDSSHDGPPWTFEAWDWMLRDALGLSRTAPLWLDLPAMMRVALSTPLVLDRLNHQTRPFNFLLSPLIDAVIGHPTGDRDRFTLIAPFTKHRDEWWSSPCINVHDGARYALAPEQTAQFDAVIPQTFGYVLRLYPYHPESKSLAPDGSPCSTYTCGLLRRASVLAGTQRYVGKETDRRWEHGEDLSLMQFKGVEYRPGRTMVVADASVRAQMSTIGLRELMRTTGVSQHTLEAIRSGRPVRRTTLQRVIVASGLIDR